MSTTTQSHLMKTTKRGRPFVKDTHDLFSTLMVSLQLQTHRSFFKTYPYSFNTDEASSNLASLKFSQSTRSADPKNPSRIITTTTTTTFSMSRDMAKAICQHFLEAHLIENATDLGSPHFKERGIYMITPKGLHILERFVTKNGITADHLLPVFASSPIAMKMLHLERRSADDEIIVTKSVMEVLFRRFAGRDPNTTRLSDEELQAQSRQRWYMNKSSSSLSAGDKGSGGGGVNSSEVDWSNGIPVRRIQYLSPGPSTKGQDEYHFSAVSAIQWLCDFTTCVGVDEAADLAAQFVRYGFLSLVSDRGRIREDSLVAVVRAGGAGGGAGAVMQEAEFRVTEKAIYKITRDGQAVAKWNEGKSKPPKLQRGDSSSSSVVAPRASLASETESRPSVSISRPRPEQDESLVPDKDTHAAKDSHAARLRQVLDEPALRSLFREFLRANFCEENLSFWLDVQDFKRRFNTTSSAVASPGKQQATGGSEGKQTGGNQAMETHQKDLIAMAFVIYNTYLAPASPCELNIDHNLRAEIISYMNQISTDNEAGLKPQARIDPGTGNTLHASQLQNMVKLYERIQTYIFRLMATDSVPKFCKTERFLTLMRQLYDNDTDAAMAGMVTQAQHLMVGKGGHSVDDMVAPSPTRAYMTISQAANEKALALEKRKAAQP